MIPYSQSFSILKIQFSGVNSNPLISHTREGVALAKWGKVEAILAVGGGSVLDEAKAIAVGALANVDVWDFFVGKGKNRGQVLKSNYLQQKKGGSS